jgi:hypothetical protein
MRGVSISLVLLGCAALHARAAEMIIQRPVWNGQEPASPALPARGFGLWFHLTPARAGDSRTLALLACARLPGRYADVYGGRVAGAIEIVAVDAATGRVYHAPAERPGAPPLAAVMNAAPAPPRKGIAPTQDMEVWFNADLRGHLGLPLFSSDYTIFLWLDEMTSQPAKAILPGASVAQAANSPRFDAPANVHWGKTSHSAPAEGIALALAVGDRFRGDVSAAVTRGARFLNLFVLDYRTRAFAASTIGLPQSFEGGFDFDANAVPGGWAPAAKRFVIAAVGGAVSNVVTLDAPAHAGGKV